MSRALSVEEALERVLAGAEPLAAESVAIEAARGRVLAAQLAAKLTQPPFDASAMDGFAVRKADIIKLPATLAVIGQAAAGHPFDGSVGSGEAVRIFTGAPVPADADAIVIQEDTEHTPAQVTVRAGPIETGHIRRRGFDFRTGDALLSAGRKLGPRELSLAAAMGHGTVSVHSRPLVGILSTGDELVAPGEQPRPGQIVSSNHLGVGALAELAGADVRQLGIARDTRDSLTSHVAKAADCDILVTIGGASVGDHDLVAPVLEARGMRLAFWKIALRPGKPLMFGRLVDTRVLGLPGNPVSALVCSRVFLVPLIRRLAGLPDAEAGLATARAAVPLDANGPRQHYMRATLHTGADGTPEATPVRSQDSSLLSPLAMADCLLIRPPHAPAAPAGSSVPILPLDF
jgi:molybdopterin molybdotransferase